MKRSLIDQSQSPKTKQSKNNHHDHNSNFENNILCNDVLSVIFSFIPISDETMLSIKLVSHQWYESLQGEFRHSLVQSIANYLSCQFEENNDRESMTRLLVSVKQWLGARQCIFIYTLYGNDGGQLYKKTTFPYVRVLSHDVIEEFEEFVVLTIHLQENVYMRMTIHYSNAEDCFAYVDVFGDYDWEKELNINPSVKRNIVFQMNPGDDMDIEDYEINREFFVSLFEMLKISKLAERNPLCVNLLLCYLRIESRVIMGRSLSIKDVEFKQNVEIIDERMEYLVDKFNLKSVNEYQVLAMAWKNATKSFTNVMEKKITRDNTNPEISVSNVTGSLVTFDLTNKHRRSADSTFDLLYKGHEFQVTFAFSENFFYGHDMNDEPMVFQCKSKTNGDTYDFSCYIDNYRVMWNEMPFYEMVPPDIRPRCYTFSDFKSTLVSIFTQWLELVPRYHLLNSSGKLFIEDDNILKFFADHKNRGEYQRESPLPIIDGLDQTY